MTPAREPRADARRNRERVLAAAQHAFATEGLGVPLDEIARRAGVGPGTVHRHFPTKDALHLAVVAGMLEGLVTAAGDLVDGDDPAALFTLLRRMTAAGIENAAVKGALELDLRTAAPAVAASLTAAVATLLQRAQAAGKARPDVDAADVLALVAGALGAIGHAGPGTRADHLARVALDGLRYATEE